MLVSHREKSIHILLVEAVQYRGFLYFKCVDIGLSQVMQDVGFVLVVF